MDIKDELDRWAVPSKLRGKIFTLERIGLGGMVIILLWLFVNCMISRTTDNKENAAEWKEMYKDAVGTQVQAAKEDVMQKQYRVEQGIDSTREEVKSLLKRTK
jgi:hypothetical protein